MKVLIIGSSGFIGEFLTRKLTSIGHECVGFDITPPSEDLQKICRCIKGNMLSREDILKAAQGVDLVITLAAKHHDFGVTREEFFHVNETGTKILLECCTELSLKKLVFYSTVAVYGTKEEPTTENTLPTPDNYYGESKLAAEKLIHRWIEEDKSRSVIIIRPTVVFGPNNFANVHNLIDKICRKRFIFVGDGKNIKSVAYVENLVDATIFLIDRLEPGVQIFNYSDEPQLTISETVDTIATYMPYSIPKIKLPLWFAVTFGSIFDFLGKITGRNYPITAARMKKFATATYHKAEKIRKLGFVNQVDIKEGFRRMVKWYLETQR